MADPDGDGAVSLHFVDGQISRLLPLGEMFPATGSEMAEGEAAAWVTVETVREAEVAAVRVEMEPLLAAGLPDWVEADGDRQGAAGVAHYSSSGKTLVLIVAKADSLSVGDHPRIELEKSHPLPPWLRWATSTEARVAIGPGEFDGYNWEPEEQRPEAWWVPEGDGWVGGSFQEVPKHFFLFADSLDNITESDTAFPGVVSAADTEGNIFAAVQPDALQSIVRESHFGGLVGMVQPGVLSMDSVDGLDQLWTKDASPKDAVAAGDVVGERTATGEVRKVSEQDFRAAEGQVSSSTARGEDVKNVQKPNGKKSKKMAKKKKKSG
jgi:hypothetical protein